MKYNNWEQIKKDLIEDFEFIVESLTKFFKTFPIIPLLILFIVAFIIGIIIGR